jgi:hypothetical protein
MSAFDFGQVFVTTGFDNLLVSLPLVADGLTASQSANDGIGLAGDSH